MFPSYEAYAAKREFLEMAADKSAAHLLDRAKRNELMVVMSASRDGEEVFPGATKQMENEIRQAGYETETVSSAAAHPRAKELAGGLPLGDEFKGRISAGPFGIAKTVGGYDEGGKDVTELSLVVSHPQPAPPPEEIVNFFVGLAKRYHQLGVIIKLPGEKDAYEYFPNGNPPIKYGEGGFSRTSPYYTRLRKGPKDRKLVYNPEYPA